MKNKVLAAFLSFIMLVSITPLSVFAVTGEEPDEAPVAETPVVEAPETEMQEAPTSATVLDIGKGNISITGTAVTYYEGDPAIPKTDDVPNTLGYTIIGVQGTNTLTINGATVPITISADVNTNGQPITSANTITINANVASGAISSDSTVTIANGKCVSAPSITQNGATQYPITITLAAAANQSVQLSVNGGVSTAMTADSTGALYLWLANDTYHFVANYGGISYPFSATTSNSAPVAAALQFAGGAGTSADPYIINDAAQFANIKSAPVACYKLNANNLTVNTPIIVFSGVFDGNGNTVNLAVTFNQAGLFSILNSGAVVKNLGLTGSVTASGSRAGSVAAVNSGTIQNVYSAASVRANSGAAGGIAGENNGTIQNCYTTGTVTDTTNGGGIAGEQSGGTIQNCYTTGAVTATTNGGGIAGEQTSGTIQNCYATGTVGGNSAAGGIVGRQTSGSVKDCMALGASVTGGAVGRVAGVRSSLSNNYSTEKMLLNGKYPTVDIAHDNINGTTLTNAQLASASTFSAIFPPSNGWTTYNGALPTLNGLTGQSASMPSYLVYTAPSNGGGGGGGGGSHEPPYSETFWAKMRDQIDDAKSGDKIKFSSTKLDNMPVSILKAIKGRNITLIITHGREKITINGKRMHPIPKNRVFYNFDDLAELYEEQPAASSKPSSPGKPVVPSTPNVITSVPTQPQYPAVVTPPASSSSAQSSSSSKPESSEPDKEIIPEEESEPEDALTDVEAEPKKPKRSAVPLVAAGIVIVLALAGGGAAFYYYRRRPQNFYDFDDDEK